MSARAALLPQQPGYPLPSAGRWFQFHALGVAIGALVLTALTGRLPRKQLPYRADGLVYGGEFAGMAGTGLYDISSPRLLTGPGARRVLFSIGPPSRQQVWCQREKRLRDRYYVWWFNGSAGHGRSAGQYLSVTFGWRETFLAGITVRRDCADEQSTADPLPIFLAQAAASIRDQKY